MKINAYEVISRPTQIAARTTTITSAALLAVGVFDLNQFDWPIIEKGLDFPSFVIISFCIGLYSVVALLINWRADYVSYVDWFKSNRIDEGAAYGTGNKFAAPMRSLERQSLRIKDLVVRLSEAISETSSALAASQIGGEVHLDKMKEQIQRLENSLGAVIGHTKEIDSVLPRMNSIIDELDIRFERANLWVKFLVYWWYLGIPSILALASWVVLFIRLDQYTLPI